MVVLAHLEGVHTYKEGIINGNNGCLFSEAAVVFGGVFTTPHPK